MALNKNAFFYLTKIESSGRGSYLSAMSFAPTKLQSSRGQTFDVIEE